MELKGLRAVVVGGASGMAKATAELVVARGGKVAILDLPTSAGQAVADELGGTFHAIDVTDFDATEGILDAAIAALDGLDAVVNTAGGGSSHRTISKDGPLPLATFRKIVDLNLVSTFNIARLAAWQMSKQEPNADGERGVIINTASIAAFEGQIGQISYTAAKGGIAAMSLTMARDLGSLGIRVNAIAPSLFHTGITKGIPEDFEKVLTKDAAFPKRMGRPDEYAKLAVSIIENPMLNGQTIRLDGGQRFAPK
ncbi:SDR family oxidoreductase [Frankia sp. CNm7]|uniref:SDR family oxidoreductase n=1 Tax=Frankia nepalensis TaxID=1836974 RepID=A0A937UUX0_9ACTN|nr:SDR family oxidoreductase [Frankia nepalensis]MBL7501169.1 SDR family oxidoreductase [Frankia nepalensis]MBL7512629.1 SDR family oxidoreductase [Frankia nepalensis]MBL7520888.1 SDR family oxidoreductase [Frankia nepalensis]MBL7632685.1 SDR family oxidoreductase [Frankia nepalensis]